MHFKHKAHNHLGYVLGYFLSYFIFTTILYFILSFLNKLPWQGTYFHVMLITLIIVLVGVLLQEYLQK